MEKEILTRLATLSHPQRMAVHRLLMRRYPDAVPAGEIGRALGLKPSTTSVYLGALLDSALATQHRRGTSLLYRANLPALGAMLTSLVNDCCHGRPDLCPLPPRADPMPDRPYSVLFLCTGNSARSIFAEALLRDLGGDRFTVHSAGTRPHSDLNPVALEMLRAKGHDIAPLRAKSIAEFRDETAEPLDFVFTVCDTAANEDCPPWDGQPISGHWGVPDPVKAQGTPAQRALAFQHAYGALKRRVELFAALPIDTLDRIALQRAVDDIGASEPEGGA